MVKIIDKDVAKWQMEIYDSISYLKLTQDDDKKNYVLRVVFNILDNLKRANYASSFCVEAYTYTNLKDSEDKIYAKNIKNHHNELNPASIENLSQFIDSISILNYELNNEVYYPSLFNMDIVGNIYDDNNHIITGTIFSIYVANGLSPNLILTTHTDVWLPYSLDGYPQFNAYRYNAPQLENTLNQIEQQTGIEFSNKDELESTCYCTKKGFKLYNLVEEDGQIIAVSDQGTILDSTETPRVIVEKRFRLPEEYI